MPWETEDDDLGCDDCIKKQSTQALKYDIEWPAKWAGVELDIRDFSDLWADDEQFIFEYLEQVDARNVVQLEDDGKNLEDDGELVRGKRYQRCPKCKVAVNLRDGCNHMSCPKCAEQFCYICGQQARDGSNHWTAAGCPRYNGRDEANAIYDDDSEDDEVEVRRPRRRNVLELVALGRVTLVPLEEQVDPEAPMHREVHSQDFALESWTWNVAMQTTDTQTRNIMQMILDFPVEDDEHQGPPSHGEQARVMGAMLRYRPEHGVREAEWRWLRVAGTNDIMTFVDGDELQGETTDRFPVRHGVLSHRVGGVFNMVNRASRRAAMDWALRRQRAWAQASDGHEDLQPDNFAIFDLGPGGSALDRALAPLICDILLWHGRQLTLGRASFTRIGTSTSTALLVQLTGPYIRELRTRLSFSGTTPAMERRVDPLHGVAEFITFGPHSRLERLPAEYLRAEISAELRSRLERALHEDLEMVHT